MSGQTSVFKYGQPVAVAGQLSDNGEVVDVVSRFSQEASAVIAFGCGVMRGTSPRGVVNLTDNSDVVEGVNVFGFNHAPGATGDIDQTNNGLKPKSGLQVLRKGRIWALIDAGLATITATGDNPDRPFCRAVSDGASNTIVGAFSNAQDGGSRLIDCTKQGIFMSGIFTAADGTSKIAELEVDFSNKP